MASKLKAYQVDKESIYAGHDPVEAMMAYCADTGHEFLGVEHCTRLMEVRRGCRVADTEHDLGDPDYTTVGAILDSMTGPGLVASTEY